MQRLRLFGAFYQSMFVLILVSSVFLSFILKWNLQRLLIPPPPFFVVYVVSFMFGGIAIGLFYNELYKANSYYFYFNKGISKTALFLGSILINEALGLSALTAFYYVQFS